MNNIDTHIAPGYSAGGCLRQVLGRTPELEVLVNSDMLSCGPLPAVSPLSRWRSVRENFLKSVYAEDMPVGDPGRDLVANAHRLRDSRSVTLWIGTGLAEQLLLAWVVAILRDTNADLGRFRVVQFDRTRNGSQIVGAGILSPDDFRSAPPAWQLLNRQVDELGTAWEAVTAAAPNRLLAFVSSAHSTLPFLGTSLRFLVDYYPDAQTGLNAWEQRLLCHARDHGPKAIRVIGHTLGDALDLLDWQGDRYLFWRLRRLGNHTLARPFVALSGNIAQMRETEVSLTPDGEAALHGRAQFVELNGIDDHAAGVHLSSATGEIWYRRDGTLVRARPL